MTDSERLERMEERQLKIEEVVVRLEPKIDRICAYLDKVESPTYRANEDAKQMVMNIISDLFSNNRLENNNR